MLACDASKRARRRIASIALNRAVEMSHARGFPGTPSRGQRRVERVMHGVLRQVKAAKQSDQCREYAAGFRAEQGVKEGANPVRRCLGRARNEESGSRKMATRITGGRLAKPYSSEGGAEPSKRDSSWSSSCCSGRCTSSMMTPLRHRPSNAWRSAFSAVRR